MYRILVVEDDGNIAGVVQKALAGWGHQVLIAPDFNDVLGTFHSFVPQLVLMDLNLPFYSGYHWCAQIRRESRVPIMFISSASDNMSMVTAIHQGADDFLVKPFDLHLMVAKVQALLRRSYDFAGEAETLADGPLVLQRGSGSALVDGTAVELTPNELRILERLLQNKGRIVGRDELIRALWEDESFVDDNTLTVNVTRLRKKLAAAGVPDCIETKKGMGYLLPEKL